MNIFEENARKRKTQYNVERNKRLRKNKIIKHFGATLPYDEVEKLNELLKEKNMNKTEFVRFAYEKLKKEK